MVAFPIASIGQYGWAFGTPGMIRNCLLRGVTRVLRNGMAPFA